MDKYGQRLIKHYKIQDDVLWQLMLLAQHLCPGGEWVFQMFADVEYRPDTRRDGHKFIATVTNGDDNVTARADTPGAAVALLIHYMLNGSVFPLAGGNAGRKTFPGDNGWVKAKEDDSEIAEEEAKDVRT